MLNERVYIACNSSKLTKGNPKPAAAQMTITELNQELGNIDLYLLDALLKNQLRPGMRLLDAGCGEGRNLHWFIRNRWDVQGIDRNPAAIRMLKYLSQSLCPGFDRERFVVGELGKLPYNAASFDAVICNAVLHFAENPLEFLQMWRELLRVLRPGGLLFVRMATTIGLAGPPTPDASGRCLLPDGSLRFVLTDKLLAQLLNEFDLQALEPAKSVVVVGQRAMCSLLLQKNNSVKV
jgi:tellurite methyltransferase